MDPLPSPTLNRCLPHMVFNLPASLMLAHHEPPGQ